MPPDAGLEPGQSIRCTKTATQFAREWGFAADYEYGADSDPAVPDMTGSVPSFANAGEEVVLQDASGEVVEALVYG